MTTTTAASRPPLRVCDPHFHVWDTKTSPNPNLGSLGEGLPVYLLKDYLSETAAAAKDGGSVDVVGLVHVEATVGQMEGGAVLDPVAETAFVVSQLQGAGRWEDGSSGIVAFVHLGRDDAEEVIGRHRAVAGDRLVGIRMILNYCSEDPSLCWPQVGRGDYLTGKVDGFMRGFSLLAKHNLSFDLQANWFQLSDAASFLSDFPDTQVVINHMGCLKLSGVEEEDEKRISVWRQGMRALSALPQVYVKASMLEYMSKGWRDKDHDDDSKAHTLVKGLVREVIDLFGAERVMFASNFPVDKVDMGPDTTTVTTLFTDLLGLVEDLPREQQKALMQDTAARFYRLHVESSSS